MNMMKLILWVRMMKMSFWIYWMKNWKIIKEKEFREALKNLDLSTGLELIYHTNYKADGYMPFTSQFYYQNNYTTQNRPTANAFLHFMIKRFKGYIRLENLNTLLPTNKTFGKSLNFNTQNYPSTGMWFRVGIWWNFIN